MRDDFGWSYRDMEIKGYGSNANLSRCVKLLDLPNDVQDKIAAGQLTKAHGTALLGLESPKEIRNMAKRALAHDWSSKILDEAVKRYLAPKNGDSTPKTKLPFDKDIPGVYFKDSKDMNELPKESVGCIFTSPPYFVGMEYEKGYTFEEHLENIEAVMKECARVTVPGGVIALNVDDIYRFKGKLGKDNPHIQFMIHKYQSFLRKHGVYLEDKIVWIKDLNPHSQDRSRAFSADTVHTTYRHIKRHDFVYIFRKKGERLVPSEEANLASTLNKDEWKAFIPSVWTIPAEWESKGHPNVFPEELARRVIKMYSFVGETVLDPFLGSGTTIKVARELDREGIGYEREDGLYKATIAEKLKGTEPVTDVEPTEGEGLADYAKSQMEESDAHQPEKPKVSVIESDGNPLMKFSASRKKNWNTPNFNQVGGGLHILRPL
jgi:DNA modification methylase